MVWQDPSEVEGEPLINIPNAPLIIIPNVKGLRPTLSKIFFILLTLKKIYPNTKKPFFNICHFRLAGLNVGWWELYDFALVELSDKSICYYQKSKEFFKD